MHKRARFQSRICIYMHATSTNNFAISVAEAGRGLNRQKLGFKKQRYSGVNLTNNGTGPMTRGRRAWLNGVSPLKRYNPTNQITQNASVSSSYSLRPQSGIQRRTPQQRRFRPAATPVQVLTRSTKNAQNWRPQFNNTQRKQSIYSANKNRWSTPLNRQTPQKMQQTLRRWKSKDGFGSTLTVSVNNPKANQNKMSGKPGVQRLGLRFMKPESEHSDPPPKGVPLKFNFRAMANHTNVTLNERFSTLKIKEQFTQTRQGGRTVILA
ncbi:UAP56-interacting factor-like isoform 2-T2 [Discoglossus pictus]